MQTTIRYALRPANSRAAVGTTDLKQSGGNLIDTDGCVILLVMSGYAGVTINFKKKALRRGYLAVLFYDDVFSIDETSEKFSVRFASFSYELIEEAIYKTPSTHFWDALYEHPVYRTSEEQWSQLNGWWRQVAWIGQAGYAGYRDELLRNALHSLFMAMDGEMIRNGGIILRSRKNRSWMLITRFFKLLPRYCKETRDVQFYAGELCITSTYLYKICRKILQVSPKELIDKQTVSEIKTYLAYTDLPVKSIAAELRFEDSSYMCRYFRRLTGVSPLDYRNNRRPL